MNADAVRTILNSIDLRLSPDVGYRVLGDYGECAIQVTHPSIGRGRKWRISEFMTKSEVVQTAFMAYMAWQEHEARESFLYNGQAIFSPHYDVDALVELSAAGRHDVR